MNTTFGLQVAPLIAVAGTVLLVSGVWKLAAKAVRAKAPALGMALLAVAAWYVADRMRRS